MRKLLLLSLMSLVPVSGLFAQEPTATPEATVTAVPSPTATAVPKVDFSACDFDKDKKVDQVTKSGKKIIVKFSKSKRRQTITLDKSYTYFKCAVVKKKVSIVAKRRLKDRWSVVAVPSPYGVSRVCPRITGLGPHQLYKFNTSGHLATTDRARACSFIGGRGSYVPGPGSLNLYDKNGNAIGVFRVYAKFGSVYNFRYYTSGPSCSVIAGSARSRTGSSEGYISLGNGTCIRINNLYGREGGV